MSVSESLSEQIVAALQSTLEAIRADGSTYHYTVDRCVRHHSFTGVPECLPDQEGVTTVHVLYPLESEVEEEASLTVRTRMKVGLYVARRLDLETEDPFKATRPQRWLVQNRLVRDACVALRADAATSNHWLGIPEVENVEITDEDRTAEATYFERWATVKLTLLVQHTASYSAP